MQAKSFSSPVRRAKFALGREARGSRGLGIGRAWGLGFRVEGLGVRGLGFRGLGFRGLRVKGLGV